MGRLKVFLGIVVGCILVLVPVLVFAQAEDQPARRATLSVSGNADESLPRKSGLSLHYSLQVPCFISGKL